MWRPWFKAAPVDEVFLRTTPVVLREKFEVHLPASRVWDELTAEHPLSWCRIIGDGITWTSEPPFGVGTTRTVNALKGLSSMREEFFIWEEGRRKAFYVVEASAPLFKRFAEDYLVEETGEGTSSFTWTVAYEPTLLGQGPLNKKLLGTILADTRKHFNAR